MKVFDKSIKAMELMAQAYQLMSETWEEADDNDILHLFDGAMVTTIREGVQNVSAMSWDEASFQLKHEVIEELKEQQKQANDKYLEFLWNNFGDNVHINEDDEITSDFRDWEEGTHREEIWHWFDEQHSRGVAYLMGICEELEWGVPTSYQKNQDGVLKFTNKHFEIRLDRSIWLLIHKESNRRWTRQGVDKSDTMKAIAEGYMTR
jgi:hypothetical protein